MKKIVSQITFAFISLTIFSCNNNSTENGEWIETVAEPNDNLRKIYELRSDSIYEKMELEFLNDTTFIFTYNYIIKNSENCLIKLSGELRNIDPNSDFDEMDPEGIGRATQLYNYNDSTINIEVAKTIESSSTLGVSVVINSRCKDKHSSILNLLYSEKTQE